MISEYLRGLRRSSSPATTRVGAVIRCRSAVMSSREKHSNSSSKASKSSDFVALPGQVQGRLVGRDPLLGKGQRVDDLEQHLRVARPRGRDPDIDQAPQQRVQLADRRGYDQAPRPLRVLEGKDHAHLGPVRRAADVRPLDAQGVEQRRQVVGVQLHRIRPRRMVRLPHAPAVVEQQAVVLRRAPASGRPNWRCSSARRWTAPARRRPPGRGVRSRVQCRLPLSWAWFLSSRAEVRARCSASICHLDRLKGQVGARLLPLAPLDKGDPQRRADFDLAPAWSGPRPGSGR